MHGENIGKWWEPLPNPPETSRSSQARPKAQSRPASACRAPRPQAHRGSICCTSWRTLEGTGPLIHWSRGERNRAEFVYRYGMTVPSLSGGGPKDTSKDARHLPTSSLGRLTSRKLLYEILRAGTIKSFRDHRRPTKSSFEAFRL